VVSITVEDLAVYQPTQAHSIPQIKVVLNEHRKQPSVHDEMYMLADWEETQALLGTPRSAPHYFQTSANLEFFISAGYLQNDLYLMRTKSSHRAIYARVITWNVACGL
jgi:hypothetical protein